MVGRFKGILHRTCSWQRLKRYLQPVNLYRGGAQDRLCPSWASGMIFVSRNCNEKPGFRKWTSPRRAIAVPASSLPEPCWSLCAMKCHNTRWALFDLKPDPFLRVNELCLAHPKFNLPLSVMTGGLYLIYVTTVRVMAGRCQLFCRMLAQKWELEVSPTLAACHHCSCQGIRLLLMKGKHQTFIWGLFRR